VFVAVKHRSDRNVEVKTTVTVIVRGITPISHRAQGFFEEALVLHHVFERGGMAYKLETVIYRSVMLAVGVAESAVQIVGIIVHVAAIMFMIFHLKFKAEIDEIGVIAGFFLFFGHTEAGVRLVAILANTMRRFPIFDIFAVLRLRFA
jgi:hypothetical protein